MCCGGANSIMTEWGNDNDDVKMGCRDTLLCRPPSLSPSRLRRWRRRPGGNLRAHVHDAFVDGGGVDYSPPNECEDDNKDNEEEEDEEGGGGGGGCPRDQK